MIKFYFFIKSLFDTKFMKWVANDGFFNYPLFFIFACLPAITIIFYNNFHNDHNAVKAILFLLIFIASTVIILKRYANYFIFFNFIFWIIFLIFTTLFLR